MAVEFSIPWIRSQLHSAQAPRVISDSSSVVSGLSTPEDIPRINKSFVLFVRLPDWKSSNGVSEICTLRRLRNNIELYKIKQLLELSAGIPAHVQSLFTFDDKIVSDDTTLTLGTNINHGNTLHMKIKQPWENVVRSVWKENLKEVTNHLHVYLSKQKQNKSDSVTPQERELAYLALLVASSQGNLPICKVLLLNDVDPSYSTVFGNSCLHCAAFKGNLDILQILVAYGANVRARNILGKSSMDIAISAGFVECAKWLWLHQWSISIIRSGNNESTQHTSSGHHKPQTNGFLSKLPPTNLNKLSKQQSKPSNFNNSNDTLKYTRPKTASPLRLSTSPKLPRPKSAIINDHKYPTLPKFYPEITAFLKREQSIPSKYECRYREQSDVGILGKPHHLHDFDKPVRKPERSFIIDSPPKSANPSRKVKKEPLKVAHNAPITRELFQLHGQSSEKVEDMHPPPVSPAVLPEKKSEGNSVNKGNDIIEAFLNNHKKSLENSSMKKTKVKVKSEQPNTSVLTDSVSPLNYINHSVLTKPTSLWENTTTVKTKDRPKHLGMQPNSMKRQTVKNSTLRDEKIKEEEILKRQEEQHRKSEEAYQKWLETKQREKIAKRKSEILESVGDSKYYIQTSPTTPKMWGITFDEWLESKRNMSTNVQESNEDNKKVRPKLTRGKTFDEWSKEKDQQAAKNQRSQSEPNIEDDEKLAEMRQRKFELWKKKKIESAQMERRNTEVVEHQKLIEMQQDYVQWKSKPRVMSFDEWRDKKKNDRRLSEMDNAQTVAVKFVEEWAHKDREKKAAWAFNRWLLRKEAIQLQTVQKEFKLAKERREKVEYKIELRRQQREKRRQLMAKHSNPYADDDFTSDDSDNETKQKIPNSEPKESAEPKQETVSFEAQPTVLDVKENNDQVPAKNLEVQVLNPETPATLNTNTLGDIEDKNIHLTINEALVIKPNQIAPVITKSINLEAEVLNPENVSQLNKDTSGDKVEKNLQLNINQAVVINQSDNISPATKVSDATTDVPRIETSDSLDKTNSENPFMEMKANSESIEDKKVENVNAPKIPSTTSLEPNLSIDKLEPDNNPKENKFGEQQPRLGEVVAEQSQQKPDLISVNISKTPKVASKKIKVKKKKFKAKKIVSSANKIVH